jgi:hypothetical protein
LKKNILSGITIWCLALAAIIFLLVFPSTHNTFLSATKAHPYIMGFVKVGILASMGEILAIFISTGRFKKPIGFIYRFIVWGFLGMAFALVFDLFSNGVLGSMSKGLLPVLSEGTPGSNIFTAFLTSALMNLVFGPTFMAFHRITDTYIDLGEGNIHKIFRVKLSDVINKIDWYGFISFVVFKTVPLFWIPAHTITFSLPPEYRVLMASFLSIALGGILAFSKRKGELVK